MKKTITMSMEKIDSMNEEDFEKVFNEYEQILIDGTEYIIEPMPTKN